MRLKNIFGIAFLIMLAAGAQPAIGAFWQWSKTATNNATADPSINWSEGMSPSSVNDSARAMMARLAEQGQDTSGMLVTGGSSTAYTVTTNQGFPTPTPNDGQLLAITVNATNGASPTLAVDGGTAYPIQSSPGVAVAAATLISGSPYTMKFSTANSAWMLRNFYAASPGVPLGGLVAYTGTTAPGSNFVFAAGQCLSQTTYAAYYSLLGSPGIGTCSAGQFRIIDMSGTVAAGLDTMPGFSAANRLTSAGTGCGTAMTTVGSRCANGNESRQLTSALQIPQITAANTASIALSVTSTRTVVNNDSSATGGGVIVGSSTTSTLTSTGTIAIGNAAVTSNNTSGTSTGAAFPATQPTIGVTYILRVL